MLDPDPQMFGSPKMNFWELSEQDFYRRDAFLSPSQQSQSSERFTRAGKL